MTKRVLIYLLFLTFLISSVCFGTGCTMTEDKICVLPTCTESGYTVYKKNGKTEFRDIVPATGHNFNDWITVSVPDYDVIGLRNRTCRTCGHVEREFLYISGDLSQIRFEGNLTGIDKKSQVQVSVSFVGNDMDFHGYAVLKYQGHESLRYDKKNFTVNFFEDENFEIKKKFQFLDWNEENKYILKANYLDVSRSRNLISADIWSEIVQSRDEVHERLKKTSNYGAVDGFPVEVYHNGEFLGLYHLTLHKDDDLYRMEDGRRDCIMIANVGSSPATLFKERVNWESDLEDWEVEYCGLEDSSKFKEKLNEFIDFVAHSSDAEFKASISNYADVESLIDYLIATYALGLNYNYSKDLVLISYDGGPWIASLFDMESAFGLSIDADHFEDASSGLPIFDGQSWSSGNDSLLWNRMINLFYDEISDRYLTLRGTVLSEENIFSKIENRTGAITSEANAADLALYAGQPMSDISHAEQMKNYAEERLNKLDEIFNDN